MTDKLIPDLSAPSGGLKLTDTFETDRGDSGQEASQSDTLANLRATLSANLDPPTIDISPFESSILVGPIEWRGRMLPTQENAIINVAGYWMSSYSDTGNVATAQTISGVVGVGVYGFDDTVLTTSSSSLVTFEWPDLRAIWGAANVSAGAYTAVDFGSLEFVSSSLSITKKSGTDTTLDLSSLAYVGSSLAIGMHASAGVDLSSLEYVGGVITININEQPTLPDLSSLRYTGDSISLTYAQAASGALTFTALEHIGGNVTFAIPNLTGAHFPALVSMDGGFNLSSGDDGNMTSFTFGSDLKRISGDLGFSGTAFDQASVDGILVSMAALDGSNGTTSFDNGTIDLSGANAVPGPDGAAAINTLQDRGNTVTVNT